MHGSSDDSGHPVTTGRAPAPSPAQTPPAPASSQLNPALRAARLAGGTDVAAALDALDSLVARLAAGEGPASPLLQALHARAVALHRSGAAIERCLDASEALRAAAQARHEPMWMALGHALRGLIRVEEGLAGAALADLAEADRHTQDLLAPAEAPAEVPAQAPGGAPGPRIPSAGIDQAGFLLLDTLARAFARLRLADRADLLRQEAAARSDGQSPDDVAEFRAAWAADLAVQALEPLAMATGDPDAVLLGRAEQVGSALSRMPADVVGERLGRGQDAVRALAAAYRGQPTQALRLLGRNAFGEARDLPPLHRQIATLAAMKSHVLVGSLASARSLDEAASSTPAPTVHVILDICRARERAWLEAHAGGDVQPVLQRLATLLVRLSWQGLDLVGDTVRQALEQYATREESRTDALTGVGNRRALDEELRHLLRLRSLPLGLVLIDVDHFKAVNDAFTHVVGDEVLRQVATALAGQLRAGDRLLRYGGDEFVALLPETGDAEAKQVGRRMAEAVQALTWAQAGLTVSVTTGCAALWSLTGRRPDADAERLFRRADEALLEAKRQRANPPVTAQPTVAVAPAEPDSLAAAPRSPSAAETTDWTLTPSHGALPVPAVGPLPPPPAAVAPVPVAPVPVASVPDAPVPDAPAPDAPEPATPTSPTSPLTPETGVRRRQRHAVEVEPARTSYSAGRRTQPSPGTEPEAAEPRPVPPTLIDLRDSPRRRERLRARPAPDETGEGLFGSRLGRGED